jgi:acetylornithine deacetylase
MHQLQDKPTLSTVEMLARLVGFDTTSRNSNLALLAFVRDWLDLHGVPYRLSFDPTGTKANLHATIGPVRAGGLAFAGHVDTVPVDGQAWSGDPFVLRRQDTRLLARGASDMKGFIAACLAAVPDIGARRLAQPVHLLLTYDEEVGYHGARRLVDDLHRSGLSPEVCVVGEATGMKPIVAHKGRLNVRVDVHGLTAHGSRPHEAVNAVHAASEAIAWLATESRRFAREGPFEEGFDPNYTTVQVSAVDCAPLANSIPAHAGFDAEWRNIPTDDPERELARFKAHVASTIQPAMRAISPATGFDYQVRLSLGALALPRGHPFEAAVCAASGTEAGGRASFCSEGALYQAAGIATVVCGPGHIAQIHQPDEWIDQDQLEACDRFIRNLVDRVAES